ncbi:MAG: bifunctional glycosyltransferase family 2/GtrA family protein [Clostridia bacterium]|nr:bifunctional glycosyltransferase family 2/GtrA family protein [Clostridia bacterium]
MDFIILIPAYEPDDKLTAFAKELKEEGLEALIVDDGSGDKCAAYFEECEKIGFKVVHHEVNKGKGAALRTGMRAIAETYPDAKWIITADSDGQHTLASLKKVANACRENPEALVIGGRFQDEDKIPFKSKLGNGFTRLIFKLATGLSIRDTQTGLRGFPMSSVPDMLKVKGDRYEYEMNMLLSIKGWGMGYVEVPIETVYIDNNSGTHFHPVRDSLRVLSQIFKFISASVISFLVDYLLYMLFLYAICPLIWGSPIPSYAVPASYFAARVISGIVNYFLNSRMVFKSSGPRQAAGYAVLWLVILGLGMLGSYLIKDLLGWPGIICKLLVDMPLFLLSYFVQREVIFRKKKKAVNDK